MKTGIVVKATAWAVLLTGVIFLTIGVPRSEEPSYVGEVEVGDEDASGNVTSIYIADTDEGDLLVEKGGSWAGLVDKVGETVEVWGTLSPSEDEDYDHVIAVKRFVVIEADDDDDDGEADDDDDDDDDDGGEDGIR